MLMRNLIIFYGELLQSWNYLGFRLIAPKLEFSGLSTLELSLHLAVVWFNDGDGQFESYE